MGGNILPGVGEKCMGFVLLPFRGGAVGIFLCSSVGAGGEKDQSHSGEDGEEIGREMRAWLILGMVLLRAISKD